MNDNNGDGAHGAPPRKTGLAVGLLGLGNGFMEPNAGARSTEIQRSTRTSDATLSAGWAGWPIGMFLASTVGGRLLERVGARAVLLAGGLFYFGAFAVIGFAPNIVALGAVLFVVGLGNGLFDVGWTRLSAHHDHQQEQIKGDKAGLVIQVLNGLFSLGSVVAAITGMVVVAFGLPLGPHLLAVGLAGLAVLAWSARHLPNPGATEVDVDRTSAVPEHRTQGAPRPRAPRRLRAVAVMSACATLPVGVGYLWSSIYLTRLGASETVATLGVLAFTLAETAVRLSLGVLSRRVEALRDVVRQARAGALVALVGLGLVVVPATIPTAIAGFALLAAGMAPVAGLVQREAPHIWPDHKGRATGMVSRYMYTALVAGPVVIGPLSSLLGAKDSPDSLRVALGSLLLLPVVVLALAGRLRRV
jgi:MFS family permease